MISERLALHKQAMIDGTKSPYFDLPKVIYAIVQLGRDSFLTLKMSPKVPQYLLWFESSTGIALALKQR